MNLWWLPLVVIALAALIACLRAPEPDAPPLVSEVEDAAIRARVRAEFERYGLWRDE